MSKTYPQISVRLSEAWEKEINRAALSNGITGPELVRAAADHFFRLKEVEKTIAIQQYQNAPWEKTLTPLEARTATWEERSKEIITWLREEGQRTLEGPGTQEEKARILEKIEAESKRRLAEEFKALFDLNPQEGK